MQSVGEDAARLPIIFYVWIMPRRCHHLRKILLYFMHQIISVRNIFIPQLVSYGFQTS